VRFADVPINKSGKGLELTKRHALWDRKTAAAIAAAYGGAAATVQDYSDTKLLNLFMLTAVQAPSPRLYVPYVDAAYLGLALPPDELRTYGQTQCEVRNDPTVKGRKPAADSAHTVVCQRVGPHLTVQIRGVSGDVLGTRPSTVAALVDQAFVAMS
jgi:hypothetical protein